MSQGIDFEREVVADYYRIWPFDSGVIVDIKGGQMLDQRRKPNKLSRRWRMAPLLSTAGSSMTMKLGPMGSRTFGEERLASEDGWNLSNTRGRRKYSSYLISVIDITIE